MLRFIKNKKDKRIFFFREFKNGKLISDQCLGSINLSLDSPPQNQKLILDVEYSQGVSEDEQYNVFYIKKVMEKVCKKESDFNKAHFDLVGNTDFENILKLNSLLNLK